VLPHRQSATAQGRAQTMEYVYSFDKLQILSSIHHRLLWKHLPRKMLKTMLPGFDTPAALNPHKRFDGFKTRIDIAQPTIDGLRYFAGFASRLGDNCISSLEITRDTIFATEAEANAELERIKDTVRLDGFEQHYKVIPTPPNTTPPAGIFTPWTEYIGLRDVYQLKNYTRRTKDGTNRPALRQEFTLWRPYLVKGTLVRLEDFASMESSTIEDLWLQCWNYTVV
jgi:hypothetical protein